MLSVDPAASLQSPFQLRRELLQLLATAASLCAAIGLDLFLPVDVPLSSFVSLVPVAIVTRVWGPRAGAVVALVPALSAWIAPAAALSDGLLAGVIVSRLLGAAACVALVGRLTAHHTQLLRDAERDALTGLLNRRGFAERAREELARARRHGRPISLAYLDLDGFKGINDQLGHQQGDRLLSVLGRVLSQGRAGDVAARLGGDEFVLLMPETTSSAADAALARLRGLVALALSRDGFRATFTSGLATFPEPPESLDQLLQVADERLIESKRRRRPQHRPSGVASAPVHRPAPRNAGLPPLDKLILDLRALYAPQPGAVVRLERLPLGTIVNELCLVDPSYWLHAFRGQPLTALRVSRLLHQTGLAPRRWTTTDAATGQAHRVRGYLLADLLPVLRGTTDPEPLQTLSAANDFLLT